MRKGFTLVELSIVLVIVGLLIGGILVAQSMIETSRTLKVINQHSEVIGSLSRFKSQYKYYPGDMPNARDIFGTANACNGNGSGTIGFVSGPPAYPEHIEAWNHMRLAGFEEYKGLTGCKATSCSYCQIIGTTSPALSFDKNAGFGFHYDSAITQIYIGGNIQAGHITGYIDGYRQIFQSIDGKLDDGKASTGGVTAGGRNRISTTLYTTLEYSYPTNPTLQTRSNESDYRMRIDSQDYLY